MAKRVLQPHERATGRQFGVRKWMRSRGFARAKPFYFDCLDEFRRRLSPRAEDGQASELALTQLMKVVLRNDGSCLAFFESNRHRSQAAMDPEHWENLLYSAAGYVVEAYLSENPQMAAEGADLVSREDLAQQIKELLDLAVERGAIAETAAREAKEAIYTLPHVPAMIAGSAEEIERILSEEVLVAVELGDGDIPEREREREIQKRALVNLRLSELREIAEREGLSRSGGIEIVAERLLRKFNEDEAAIARLVLDYDDPGPEARIMTRLLPLEEAPDISYCQRRFGILIGRYVRIRVAKWFLVREVQELTYGIRVLGGMRYYQVEPREEGDEVSLAAFGRAGDVALRLRRGERWVEADVQRGADSASLAIALQRAARTKLRPGILTSVTNRPPDLSTWDLRSFFLIDFVSRSLMGDGFTVVNMRIAEFATDHAQDADDPRRPAVTAVRLQGQHLLSSPQACQFLIRGRALVGLSLVLKYRPSQQETFYAGVKLTLGEADVTVRTEFGEAPPGVSREIHYELLRRLRKSLETGTVDVGQFRKLADRIRKRAAAREDDVQADILEEPPDASNSAS